MSISLRLTVRLTGLSWSAQVCVSTSSRLTVRLTEIPSGLRKFVLRLTAIIILVSVVASVPAVLATLRGWLCESYVLRRLPCLTLFGPFVLGAAVR